MTETDRRITEYIEAAERLKRGDYQLDDLPTTPPDDVGRLGQLLQDLANILDVRYRETRIFEDITAHVNAGLLLEEVLDNVYVSFKGLIPYNRIGFSLISDDHKTVRAHWARTDQPEIKLKKGFSALLEGSSLNKILKTRQPRIINDLEDYLRRNPGSQSTRLIVAEGIHSSLTCPLIANGIPIGFIFFSSVEKNTYTDVHVATFQKIASHLSVIVEKGRMVSEIISQKEEIEAKNEELQRLNELKNSYVGVAAHDLRSPISTIRVISDLLSNPVYAELTPEQTLDLIQEISQHADYMLDLINNMLDITQIESGYLELNLRKIDLQSYIASTIRYHEHIAAAKGTQIQLMTVPAGMALADPIRLRQVFDNLLSNAVKYSPAESSVTVRTRRDEDVWFIEVVDDGPGIREDEWDKIFEPFSRLSTQPTGGERSTGLGLAITRRVIEAHGGEIGFRPCSDGGAIFWFTLPAAD